MSAPPGSREPTALVLLCFLLSGMAGLIMEIAWSRSLSLHVGGSAEGLTAVVTAYMAGLGLGSLLISYRADRIERPLRAYAFLEIAIALFAIASPWILRAPQPLYRLAHDAEEISPGLPFAVRFATSLVLLLVPTTAMGSTLPLLVACLTQRGGAFGSRVALLYGINTIGAVLGATTAGFLFLPGIGTKATLWIAAGVDLAVAAMLLLGPSPERTPRAGRDGIPASARGLGQDAGRASGSTPPIIRTLALVAFGVSGALSMAYELGWTRRLVSLWGSSVYSFTILLSTFLAGIGLGSLVAKRLAERTRHPARAFAAALGVTGAAALASTSLISIIPTAFRRLLAASGASAGSVLAGEFGLAALVLLPPSLLLGAAFPLAARVARRTEEDSGRASGRAYAINTAGTIIGSMGTGLFLLPTIGAFATLRAAALCHLLLGLALLFIDTGALGRRLAGAATLAGSFALIWILAPEPDPFHLNYGLVSLMRDRDADAASPLDLKNSSKDESRSVRLLSVEEGRTATVAVTSIWESRGLVINGKVDASSGDPYYVLIGQLPMLIADSPRQALVVGYGSGITTHSVLTHPIERVETVEIEPAVYRAGRFFADLNGRHDGDTRSVLYFEDGRSHLTYTRRRYDVIISQPSNPWIAGINNLFTEECLRLIKQRLAPGGVFCQWIQSYELSRESLASLLATSRAACPGAEVYRNGPDLVILWKEDGAFLTEEHVRKGLASAKVREDLQRVGFRNEADLFALYLGPIESVVPRDTPAFPNTDDSAFVEFRAPFDLLRGGDPHPFALPPLASLDLQRWNPSLSRAELLALLARGVARRHDLERLTEIADELRSSGAMRAAAATQADIDNLSAARSASGRVGRLNADSDAALAAGDTALCEKLLAEAASLLPDDPDVQFRLGRLFMQLGRKGPAEESLRRALAGHEDRMILRRNTGSPYLTLLFLGILASEQSRFEEALSYFQRDIELNPYQAGAYYFRARAFMAMGRMAEAKKDIAAGLAIDPDDPPLRKLAQIQR